MNDQSTATATTANVTDTASSPITSPQHGAAKASQSHLFAQQLNNSAALCIEVGHYRRAISSLQKALELNRNHRKEWKDRNEQVCKCYSCTLEGCITYSEKTASEAAVVASIHSYAAVPNSNTKDTKINDVDTVLNNNNNKRRKVCTSPSVKIDSTFWKPPSPNKQQQRKPESFSKEHGDQNDSNKENASSQVPFDKSISNSSTTPLLKQRQNSIQQSCREEEENDDDDDDDDDSISGGYIYRRPIRVSCEGHAMGSTLYLIITFNLALAHHLEVISCCDGANAQHRSKLVNRTLVLYELTYKWHLKLLCTRRNSQAPAASITASSSLSSSSPPSSTPQCTAVTSIRFNMIIRNNLSQIHRFVGNYAKHKKCLQHLLSTVMVVTEYKSRMPMNRVMSHRTKDPRCMELDGFLQNTTAIVLQKGHCANAA